MPACIHRLVSNSSMVRSDTTNIFQWSKSTLYPMSSRPHNDIHLAGGHIHVRYPIRITRGPRPHKLIEWPQWSKYSHFLPTTSSAGSKSAVLYISGFDPLCAPLFSERYQKYVREPPPPGGSGGFLSAAQGACLLECGAGGHESQRIATARTARRARRARSFLKRSGE